MTLVAKSSKSDTIFLPEQLMELLNLQDGESVKAIVEGQTIRLARLEAFLNLRGSLADDEAFDAAMQTVENSWKSWSPNNSV